MFVVTVINLKILSPYIQTSMFCGTMYSDMPPIWMLSP